MKHTVITPIKNTRIRTSDKSGLWGLLSIGIVTSIVMAAQTLKQASSANGWGYYAYDNAQFAANLIATDARYCPRPAKARASFYTNNFDLKIDAKAPINHYRSQPVARLKGQCAVTTEGWVQRISVSLTEQQNAGSTPVNLRTISPILPQAHASRTLPVMKPS